jgi:hypothetical protein
MNIKGTINTISNVVLFWVICALSGTGLLLETRLDGEGGLGRILGMTADNWGEIHLALALTFIGLVAIHALLHWPWIKIRLRQYRLGALVIGALLVSFMLVLPSNYSSQSEHGERGRAGDWDD